MSFNREKRTKSEQLVDLIPNMSHKEAMKRMSEYTPQLEKILAEAKREAKEKGEAKEDDEEELPSDEQLERDDLPVISWWEQDLDKGGPRRLIKRIATPEDRKKQKKLYMMMLESDKNPDYALENKEYQRMLIDSLIENPNFADFTEQLKEMRADVKTRAEHEEEFAKIMKQSKDEQKELVEGLKSNLKEATQMMFQGLLEEPAAAAVKEEIQEVLDKLPDMEDFNSPEIQAIIQKAMDKLDKDPNFQEKLASAPVDDDALELQRQLDEIKRADEDMERIFSKDESEFDLNTFEDDHGVTLLMEQMRDVLKAMGGDPSLEAELNDLIAYDPLEEEPRLLDMSEVTGELAKLVAAQAPKIKAAQAEERVPAELQAKVDKIMEDPRLMEKLVYIQKLIEETQRAKFDITSIAHEVAPDPYQLEDTRTVTLKQRMQAARRDPEHIAALDRLRVTLPPPFNISPALKSFNQAIEFAYIGANDDIRRVLWRSYQKARTLPTFLQNLSDDAWDILYYSQAVTWGSNQNRQDHLRALLADLNRLGRNGPPTHPSTLVKRGDGEYLENSTEVKA